MTKIIHAADFHLGAKFSGLGKSGDFVRKALKNSFEFSINSALENKVDLFLVAGDLFDSNKISRNLLHFVFHQVERLGRIPFVVLPGTHDCLDEDSIYWNLPEEKKPDNFIVLTDLEEPSISLPDSDITIYGRPNVTNKSDKPPLDGLQKNDSPGIHIAVLHGSLQIPGKSAPDDYPIHEESLESSEFDYIALGHWHSYQKYGSKAAYSGSPEVTSFSGNNKGQVLLVEIDSNKADIKPIETSLLKWHELKFSTSSFKHNIEIEQELKKYLDSNALVRVEIVGAPPENGFLDLELLRQENALDFCFLDIIDKQELSFDTSQLENLPEDTILSEYYRMISEKIDKAPDELKDTYREALHTGCALLSGKDVI